DEMPRGPCDVAASPRSEPGRPVRERNIVARFAKRRLGKFDGLVIAGIQEVALGDFFPKLVNFNLVEKPDDFVLREILGGLRRLVVLDKAVDDAPDMLDVVTLLGAALSLTLIGAGDIGRLARAAAAEILPVNRLWQRFPAPFAAAFGELVETLGIRMVGIGLHPEMEFFISRGVGGRMHIALEFDVPEKN